MKQQRLVPLACTPLFIAVLLASPYPQFTEPPPGPAVPVSTLQNPVVGYAMDVPEDYEITTGFDGDVQMTLNGSHIASVYAPWYYFLYTDKPPEESARGLAYVLSQPPLRSVTQIQRGAFPGEVVLTAAFPVEGLGKLAGRWHFRTASHKNPVRSTGRPPRRTERSAASTLRHSR